MKRRSFLKKSMWTGLGISLISGFYAWRIEPFRLEFVKLKMPIKNLPDHLVGKTLMQISDVHVGNRFDWNYLIESFKKAKKFNPDFVVYTGDFVMYEDAEQFTQLETVFKHVVKGKQGTAGVLGNHDYGDEWIENDVADKIVRILEDSGVRMLRNEKINFNGLIILGIDDYWGTNFYPETLLKNCNKKEANVVLCHNPDVCDLPVWNGYNSWILSGHTHGGQVKPPFLPAPMLPVKNKRYSAGEFDLDGGRKLYINRAIGHLWQIRFNVLPEITIFTLEKA